MFGMRICPETILIVWEMSQVHSGCPSLIIGWSLIFSLDGITPYSGDIQKLLGLCSYTVYGVEHWAHFDGELDGLYYCM